MMQISIEGLVKEVAERIAGGINEQVGKESAVIITRNFKVAGESHNDYDLIIHCEHFHYSSDLGFIIVETSELFRYYYDLKREDFRHIMIM